MLENPRYLAGKPAMSTLPNRIRPFFVTGNTPSPHGCALLSNFLFIHQQKCNTCFHETQIWNKPCTYNILSLLRNLILCLHYWSHSFLERATSWVHFKWNSRALHKWVQTTLLKTQRALEMSVSSVRLHLILIMNDTAKGIFDFIGDYAS